MTHRAKWNLALAGALLLVLGPVLIGLARRPPPPSDADLQPAIRSVTPDQDAGPLLAEAADLMQVPAALGGTLGQLEAWTETPQLIEGVLATNRAALAKFRAALRRPAIRLPVPPVYAAPDTYLQEWRRLAHLAAWQADARAGCGDVEGAWRGAFDLVEFGARVQAADGTLLHYLVGASIKRAGMLRLRRFAWEPALPTTCLTEGIQRLAAYGPDLNALTNTLKVEYRLAATAVEAIRSGAPLGTNLTGLSPRMNRLGTLPLLSVSKTKALQAERTRRALGFLRLHYAQVPVEPEPPRDVPAFVGMVMRGNLMGELIADWTFPEGDGVALSKCREHNAAAAAQVALAVACYTREHGTWPSSLDVLVPDYLPSVPLDDFDGRPLRYLPGRRWVYSVGSDLEDNGGRRSRSPKVKSDDAYELAP